MGLRSAVPWWAKIAAKLVLSRLPAGYRVWERLGLFVHGAMDDPAYAWRVVSQHLARTGWPDLHGRVVLELGPGDSLATAVIARALGARETWLVDAGAFARTDLAPYRRLAAFLRAQGLEVVPLETFSSVREMLDACGARYETDGLRSLRRIPSGHVDLVFSQAVLEHVRLGEFDELIAEMRRVLRAGGVTSHQIDLKDHLQSGLHNLRFSDRAWESPLMASSGFYTNRLRRHEIVARFEAAGFITEISGSKQWPSLPLARRKMAPRFRGMADDELRVTQFDLLARPRGDRGER